MKKIILAASAAFALTACASTQTAYGPIDSDGIGFKSVQYQPDRMRVSFTARNSEEARDYVLLRAAELTEAEGYSYFKVIDGRSDNNGPRARIGSSIGVATGFGGRRGFGRRGPIVDLGLGVDDIGRVIEGDKVRETIEVILLPATLPNDPDVYHAPSIIKSVQPRLYQ